MPVPPSTWVPGPLSPQQLNTDLVSFDGTGFSPNGILFHAHERYRPERPEPGRP
jgi:hypothetical protein